MKNDDEYLADLLGLFAKCHGKIGTVVSRWHPELKDWVISKTPKLDAAKNVTMSTRIYWILHGIDDFPVCPTCGKPIMANASVTFGYSIMHCSNRCASLDVKVQDMKKRTCMERYNVEFAWQAETVKRRKDQTMLERYGAKCPMASDICREKYKKTNMKKYGVEWHIQADSVRRKTAETNMRNLGADNPWKVKECQDKCRSHYTYDGIDFDSAPEIALYIYLKDKQLDFKYQPDKAFEYEFNGKIHKYMPDFLICGEYIELKGNQFLKADGTWQNPFDHAQDALYEAKHQCVMHNDVRIIYAPEYQKYLDYVDGAYGHNYIDQFKNSNRI